MTSDEERQARREFLAVGGALLASSAARSVALEDDSEPVRVAVIGTGGRGCDLTRSLSTIDGAEIVGVCDDYPPHLERGAGYAGPKAKAFADYRPMIAQLRPKAVILAVPLDQHFAIAGDLIGAGCDVFCEKTMCYSVEQARRLAEKVEQSGRVFQVGLQLRSNAIYQQAAAMVHAGILGQITAMKLQWHRNNDWRRPTPVPKTDPQWSALERQLNWRLYQETSGGLMTELGSHQLDIANWMLGSTPRRVMATGGVDYWRDGRDVADNVFCIYEYDVTPTPRGAAKPSSASDPYIVRVTYSSLCNNAYEGASELIMGTKGTLYLTARKGLLYREKQADDVRWAKSGIDRERADKNASIIAAGKTLKLGNSPWAHRGEPMEIDTLVGDETRDELVSFLDHVRRGDKATVVDAKAGLLNTATVLMANEAMRSGSAIDFPTIG